MLHSSNMWSRFSGRRPNHKLCYCSICKHLRFLDIVLQSSTIWMSSSCRIHNRGESRTSHSEGSSQCYNSWLIQGRGSDQALCNKICRHRIRGPNHWQNNQCRFAQQWCRGLRGNPETNLGTIFFAFKELIGTNICIWSFSKLVLLLPKSKVHKLGALGGALLNGKTFSSYMTSLEI